MDRPSAWERASSPRIHCTRLAGGKADTWFLRQYDRVLDLPFRADLARPMRDNVVDGFINQNEEDVCAEGNWQKYFTSRPQPLTAAEKRAYLDGIRGVSLGSDAFFPFDDNIQRPMPAAWTLWPSPAVQSGTMRSLPAATVIICSWPLPECGCSITKEEIMKLLVVGGGGREHAIIRSFGKIQMWKRFMPLPGNAGMEEEAQCVNVGAKDIPAIVDFAVTHEVDYAVVAPDDPLVLGAVDALRLRDSLASAPGPMRPF